MIKILITGVYGTGKTSLVSKLKNELELSFNNIKNVDEVARTCPFNLNKEQSLLSTSWLTMAQISNELQIKNTSAKYVIFDRGLPDIIAHTKYVIEDDESELHFIEQLEELGKASLSRFDHIFLAKRSDRYKIVDDGIRVTDVNFQKALEDIQISYLNKTKINYTVLVEDNESRVKQIIQSIFNTGNEV